MFKNKITRTRPYTLQEAFNRIWKFFIVEKHPQSADESFCRYRSKDSACAVGCLIPDSRQIAQCEGEGVSYLIGQVPLARKLLQKVDMGLLTQLQSIHDNAQLGPKGDDGFLPEMKKGLKRFAKQNKLAVPA